MLAYRHNVAPSRPPLPPTFTKADVLAELHRQIAAAGGQNHLAAKWGVCKGTVSKLHRGLFRPGPTMARRLGFEPFGELYRRLPR